MKKLYPFLVLIAILSAASFACSMPLAPVANVTPTGAKTTAPNSNQYSGGCQPFNDGNRAAGSHQYSATFAHQHQHSTRGNPSHNSRPGRQSKFRALQSGCV